VLVRDRRWTAQRVWSWIATAALVTLMLAIFAAPAAAAPSLTKLSGATVAPRTGTTSTPIVVSVIYSNDKGSRAERVTVTVGSEAHPMVQLPGGDWGHGVTFRWSGTAKAGTLPVTIYARAKDHSEATLAAGTVKIDQTAAPTPAPTPKATTRPTAKPVVRATPRPTSRPAIRATTTATPTPTAKPDPYQDALAPIDDTLPPTWWSPEPSPEPSALPLTAAVTDGTGPEGPDSGGTDIPTNPGGPGTGGGKARAWGPIASVLAVVGLGGPSLPALSLGPTLVTTTGAVTTAMAFGLFGRRRREDDLSDEELALAAASGVGVMPHQLAGSMVPAAAIGSATQDRPTGTPLTPEDDETLLPRWRRPSLLQARKADPIRDSSPAPRLTFSEGLVGPLAGHERRFIRYRVVRLLDSPDELRGTEIGYLDQGDEVQLLEKYGAYWLVLSPDGQQGWLHKMVLGDVVDADGPPAPGAVATMPTVADSWTMGEADVDMDVFEAYLGSRRRGA
jgi:hypothetical protein